MKRETIPNKNFKISLILLLLINCYSIREELIPEKKVLIPNSETSNVNYEISFVADAKGIKAQVLQKMTFTQSSEITYKNHRTVYMDEMGIRRCAASFGIGCILEAPTLIYRAWDTETTKIESEPLPEKEKITLANNLYLKVCGNNYPIRDGNTEIKLDNCINEPFTPELFDNNQTKIQYAKINQNFASVLSQAKLLAAENKKNEMFENWIRDSSYILNIFAEIRKFRKNGSESQLQIKEQQNLLETSLLTSNKIYHKKQFSISAAYLEDVIPEKELSSIGKVKAKELALQMKGYIVDPEKNIIFKLSLGFQLALCEPCFQETGRFEAIYAIPIPDINDSYENIYVRSGISNEINKKSEIDSAKLIQTKIKVYYTNKQKALELKKGSINPLTGIIKTLYYADSPEYIEIAIE
ncbi:hypothetical protein LFX15_18845 [Leptospira levettii]|uniref:hypothetical protein n=1 Tax=Leptospira levettii TaxID=2023178 RepID=UPI001EEA92B8|nr:hypothetical protein [Leptospira levettii]MCG6150361.1 hypothetical protein [Leptospira levettii]